MGIETQVDSFQKELEQMLAGHTIELKEKHEMYSQLFLQYLTPEHESIKPHTVFFKPSLTKRSEKEE
uniref:Uncharacterized protein n=1 Tax=Romanomermis culicivorax TaxID=13658 RepID=A0A915L8S0_ROMCU